jgi:nicotinate-nucleotide pyrophosphorylase (carboxylating)
LIEVVKRALEEDIGNGDITSTLCINAEAMADGRFFARQELILSGSSLLPLIYEARGGVERLEVHASDGQRMKAGDEIAYVRGRARTLLECERVALNFMQRLSGVATLARKFADAVAGTGCRILDTRKTTPGLRALEKAAAAAGGATNHRMGLYDAVLIKNNHIVAAGGVRAALDRCKSANVRVEIEVRTWQELEDALSCGAKHLLIDNLTPAEAAVWVAHVAGRATTEISGGVTLETVRDYAQAGADFISVGAITHSAVAVDINFRLAWS